MQKLITDLEQYVADLEVYLKETVAEMLHQELQPAQYRKNYGLFNSVGFPGGRCYRGCN